MQINSRYPWVVLSNATLGTLIASINGSIILISLPAIFRGLGVDPLASGQSVFLLWILMGYMLVTAVLLVTCGRISDMFGRVKLYNLGFVIFTMFCSIGFRTQQGQPRRHGDSASASYKESAVPCCLQIVLPSSPMLFRSSAARRDDGALDFQHALLRPVWGCGRDQPLVRTR